MAGPVMNQATVELIANVTKYVDGMREAGEKTKKHAHEMGEAFEGAKEKWKELAGVVAAGFTAEKLIEFSHKIIESADEIGKMAEKTGISTEKLSQYKYAAASAGVQTDMLQASLGKLGKTTAEAAAGSPQQVAAFNALGISQQFVKEHANDLDAVFQKILERFPEYEDGATKARLAQDLFGLSGSKMIPWLNQGAKGFEEAANKAKLFGLVISKDVAKSAAEINDNIGEMKAVVEGLATQTLTRIIPRLAEASKQFVDWAANSEGLKKTIQLVGDSLVFVVEHVDELVVAAKLFITIGLAGEFSSLVARTGDWITKLKESNVTLGETVKEMGLLRTGISLAASAMVGWQIGTYLRNEFTIVAQAGDYMVQYLLLGWENLKTSVLNVWQVIQKAIAGTVNMARETGAELIDIATKVAKFSQPLLAAQIEAAGTAMSNSLRAGKTDLKQYDDAIAANVTALAAQHKQINETFAEMVKYDGEVHNVAEAHKEGAASAEEHGKKTLAYGANAAEAQRQADELAKAMDALNLLSAKVAGTVGGPLAKANADYIEQVIKINQLGQVAIKNGGDLARVGEAEAKATEIAANAYKLKVDLIKVDSDTRTKTLTKLKEEAQLIGLSTQQSKVQAIVLAAVNEAKQKNLDLDGKYVGDSAATTAAINAQVPAFAAQVEAITKAMEARQRDVEAWKRYQDIVSSAFDSMLQSSANWAVSGFKHAKDFWRDMVGLVRQSVAQMLAEWAKTKIIGWFVGNGNSGGSIGEALLGSIGSAFAGGGGGGGAGLSVAGNTAAGGIDLSGGAGGGSQATGGFNYQNMLANYGMSKMVGGNIPGVSLASLFSHFGSYGANMGAGMYESGSTFMGPPSYLANGGGGAGYGAGQAFARYAPWAAAAGGALYGWQQGGDTPGKAAGAAAYGTAAFGLTSAAMAGTLAAIPVVGWIAIAAIIVDKISGGKLFGTKLTPKNMTETVGLSASGVGVNMSLYSEGQKSFFRGTKRQTKDVAVDAETLKAAQDFFDSLVKNMQQVARLTNQQLAPMIEANYKTISEYDKKGHITSTKYLVEMFGRSWEEATAEAAASRINSEAIIAQLDFGKASAEATKIAEHYRDSAEKLGDAAQTMVQATVDINKGMMLLGGGDSLTSMMAWVAKNQAGSESLSDTYSRLAQASQTYRDTMQQVNDTLSQLSKTGTPIEAMADAIKQVHDSAAATIKTLTDAATAAGLQAAAESDLTKVHEIETKQIEAMTKAFWAGIDQQTAAFNAARTPAGDYYVAIATITDSMRTNIAQANMLAKENGRAGASEEELARIRHLATLQATQAMQQLMAVAQQQVRSLYGTAFTLNDVNSDIAALQAKADAATSSMEDFGSSIQDVADGARKAMELMLGDLSPLNDQQKLQQALAGQMGGMVSPEQVLQIGRRLYASSQAYNDLFNQVMQIGDHTGATQAGGGGGGKAQSAGLTPEESQRLKDLLLQRDDLQKAQRLDEARSLADTIATIAKVNKASLEDAAKSLNLDLGKLMEDLGMTPEQFQNYIKTLQTKNNDIIPDSITTNTDRLIAVLREIFGIGVAVKGTPITTTGPTLDNNPTAPTVNTLNAPATKQTITDVKDAVENNTKVTRDSVADLADALRALANAMKETALTADGHRSNRW